MRKLYKYDEKNGAVVLKFVPSGNVEEIEQGITVHPFNIDFNTLDFSEYKSFIIDELYTRSARLNNPKLITLEVLKDAMFIAALKWLKDKGATL